ncbi:conserved domain protein [Treponema primitia ZAS-2]|uniref:Conserved domain protein n=1 Tax=Treponema primitia (strain ATCC BAA-887 / DSM 12427 / ZAS-2) TaxID=545694 RepID=F5YP42_TREPZ|nr:type II toxin-antitoxin system HicA family toxin [Treponema primitia]AEF85843.1 conserved domain protein [Treponema primitia ZAS-2]
MKRADLIKKISKLGAVLERHGANHDWYVNHKTGAVQAVPRHNEIKEPLAKAIIKVFS